jgi:hypothetical protein
MERATSRQSTRLQTLLAAALASGLTVAATAGSGSAGPAAPQAPPSRVSPASISGTPRVNATLTADPGAWAGTTPITFSYQWIRCTSQLSNCVQTRVTSRSYRLSSADRGRRLIVVITARNRDGTGQTQVTSNVIAGPATAPRSTSPPPISGTPQEGQTLTAAPGGWTGTPPVTFFYEWQRCDANGAACAGIPDATSRSYVASTTDVGRRLRVVVTARNSMGFRSRASAPTPVIQQGPPPGPEGQIRLPSGRVSIPVTSVSLPARLIVNAVGFSPNPVRSRAARIAVRVQVVETRGFVVRGALVFLRSTPLVTTAPPETPTGTNGWATVVTVPRSAPGIRFPLQNGLNVQFYVQARKPGDRIVAGVTGSRLVQVRTASPR